MAKYHLNYKGEPGPCRATKTCPFGDMEKDHFSSPEEARSAYEKAAAKNFGFSPKALSKRAEAQAKKPAPGPTPAERKITRQEERRAKYPDEIATLTHGGRLTEVIGKNRVHTESYVKITRTGQQHSYATVVVEEKTGDTKARWDTDDVTIAGANHSKMLEEQRKVAQKAKRAAQADAAYRSPNKGGK